MLFEQYEERLKRRGRSDQTIYNFRSVAIRHEEWLRERGIELDQMNSALMEDYLDSLPFQSSTKRAHLVQLRAAYRYGMRRGLLESDPTLDVELPETRLGRPNVLSFDDLRSMKTRAEGTDRFNLLFHLYAYTGLRRDEGRLLTWDAVDLRTNTLDVIGKNQKRRLVPIHPALGELLAATKVLSRREYVLPGRGGTVPSTGTLAKWLRKIHPTATFHDFRRTVASSLDANGVEEGIIMRIMGWAPRSIFDRHYRNVADERLQAAILRLYADNPI